jgi:predicted nucleic acid-binding Zn ribbon protein
LRFVDYKCNDCGKVSEIVTRSSDNNGCEIKCENCNSSNMIRIFAPVGLKSSSGSDDFAASDSSQKSCSGGSCSSCSGCH